MKDTFDGTVFDDGVSRTPPKTRRGKARA